MSFDNCPRCGGNWTKSIKPEVKSLKDAFDCLQCGMFKQTECLMLDINGGTLYWNLVNWNSRMGRFEADKCFYFVTHDNKCPLPWLPFDITEDRLKLLLVFS